MGQAARFVLIASALAASLARAQTVFEPADLVKFNAAFEEINGDRLKCNAKNVDPALDFAFRFELRYFVSCEVSQFGGAAGELRAFVRVRPEDGRQLVLGDEFSIPAAPKALSPAYLKKVHALFQFSGALAAGVGQYHIELLLVDNRRRVYRQHWNAKAFPHGREHDLHFSMPPNTLAPLTITPIPTQTATSAPPLTVLINAAPLNPWSLKLRAWDRAFLLDSLSSLLRQLSYSSVRVIAFNLDQQQEVFRRENFGQRDMPNLAHALRSLELGTVAYSTLQRQQGWAELLVGLLKEESQSGQRSQAVVFLGPTVRLEDKVPAAIVASFPTPPPPLFCVAYYPRMGADFPDSIQQLTAAFKGRVFRIHSPSELAQNLEKLQGDIEGEASSARTMRPAK